MTILLAKSRININDLFRRIDQRQKAFADAIKKGRGGVAVSKSDKFVSHLTKGKLNYTNIGAVAKAQNNTLLDNEILFTITTRNVDRDGDIVEPMGARLKNYARNPVIFFGHQEWVIPIASAADQKGNLRVWPKPELIKSVARFDTDDPDADFVLGKVKRGFLNAVSIAFVPIQAERREDVEKAHYSDEGPVGWIFRVWDCTEYSVVGVPSQANAIRDSLDQEKSFMSPRLRTAMAPFAARAKGRCFSGWCPCEKSRAKDDGKGVTLMRRVGQHGYSIFYDGATGGYATSTYRNGQWLGKRGFSDRQSAESWVRELKSVKSANPPSDFNQDEREAFRLGQEAARDGKNDIPPKDRGMEYAGAWLDGYRTIKPTTSWRDLGGRKKKATKRSAVDDAAKKYQQALSQYGENNMVTQRAEITYRELKDKWEQENGKKYAPMKSQKAQPSDEISSKDACAILDKGTVDSKPLTDDQRRMFGAACSRSKKWIKSVLKDTNLKSDDRVEITSGEGAGRRGTVVAVWGNNQYSVIAGGDLFKRLSGDALRKVRRNPGEKSIQKTRTVYATMDQAVEVAQNAANGNKSDYYIYLEGSRDSSHPWVVSREKPMGALTRYMRVVQPTKEAKSIRKYITHDGDVWTVHAESGKVLGKHPTESSARRQLAAIEANKHKGLYSASRIDPTGHLNIDLSDRDDKLKSKILSLFKSGEEISEQAVFARSPEIRDEFQSRNTGWIEHLIYEMWNKGEITGKRADGGFGKRQFFKKSQKQEGRIVQTTIKAEARSEEYEEGYEARLNNVSRDRNPYKRGAMFFDSSKPVYANDWDEGWRFADRQLNNMKAAKHKCKCGGQCQKCKSVRKGSTLRGIGAGNLIRIIAGGTILEGLHGRVRAIEGNRLVIDLGSLGIRRMSPNDVMLAHESDEDYEGIGKSFKALNERQRVKIKSVRKADIGDIRQAGAVFNNPETAKCPICGKNFQRNESVILGRNGEWVHAVHGKSSKALNESNAVQGGYLAADGHELEDTAITTDDNGPTVEGAQVGDRVNTPKGTGEIVEVSPGGGDYQVMLEDGMNTLITAREDECEVIKKYRAIKWKKDNKFYVVAIKREKNVKVSGPYNTRLAACREALNKNLSVSKSPSSSQVRSALDRLDDDPNGNSDKLYKLYQRFMQFRLNQRGDSARNYINSLVDAYDNDKLTDQSSFLRAIGI